MLLGKQTQYVGDYDKSLLDTIDRSIARDKITLASPVEYKGFDIWNCYEVSWLQISGKPEVRLLEIIVPADSKKIVESKSLKLYLNSLNNSRFKNEFQVIDLIKSDLSEALGTMIYVKMQSLDKVNDEKLHNFFGINLDLFNIIATDFNVNKNLLSLDNDSISLVVKGIDIVTETLYSNLFKSNCCVTGQPDWASVRISYTGKKISSTSLLKYLVSFRNHQEFHEQCCERIFTDIKDVCNPSKLTVYMRYTRRGGIDINPIRSTEDLDISKLENLRQVRQ